MQDRVNVAVVGATGAIGEALFELLSQSRLPVGDVYALDKEHAAGMEVTYNRNALAVRNIAEFDFTAVQIAFFCAGSAVSAQYAPVAAASGCTVIDNSSQFRYEPNVPLIVPAINAHAAAHVTAGGIIASPHSYTRQLLLALHPIYQSVGIDHVNVVSHHAVSATGKKAVEELVGQTANLLNMRKIDTHVYPRQIAFNVIPQVGKFTGNGYTKDEMALVWETQKILEDPDIMVNPTAVRVPVFYGHSQAVHIETRDKITAESARSLLRDAPGLVVLDDRRDGGYPTAVSDASGKDTVFIGRIREDISHSRGLDLWIVADNVRTGAALNSIQIAENIVSALL